MDEADLAGYGIHRIPIPIPFPQAGGPVNVYLVEEAGGGVTMFDSGIGTPAAEGALDDGVRRAGHRFDEITRIVLSHGHVDHYWAAASVVERAGRAIPVLAHPADIPKVAASGARWSERVAHYQAYLARLGVADGEVAAIMAEVGRSFTMARRVPEVTPLEPGAVLEGRRVSLAVHHMPGHTPGLLCLHEARLRLFFSSDHLLEKISPNPLIELGPAGEEGAFRPLLAYLDSVARLRALDVAVVLPGHGPPFTDHRRVIDGLLAFYAKRQEKIRAALAGGVLTALEVARVLFPWARTQDLFLVLSETIANLEVLEARGAVARALEDGVYRFRLA